MSAAISATASIPTANASKYLQQLCKHWAHNLDVTFDATQGAIVFPKDARGADWSGDASVTLSAMGETLNCRIDASEREQLDGLKGAIARHLNRFAFREAPLSFDWK